MSEKNFSAALNASTKNMTPTIRHLPLRTLDATQSNNLTPGEVTAWLDARDRERHRRQWDIAANIALVIVGVALIYVTYKLLTT